MHNVQIDITRGEDGDINISRKELSGDGTYRESMAVSIPADEKENLIEALAE